MACLRTAGVFVAVACLILPGKSSAQQPVAAASVDGQPIYVSEVQREVKRALKNREVTAAQRSVLTANALEQIIRKRLILLYLDKHNTGASAQDIDFELEQVKKKLARQKLTLQSYLQRTGFTEEQFRRVLSWQIGWQRYLKRFLTETNLQTYFKRHQREFDGSKVRVRHILFKTGAQDAKATIAQAAAVREKIVSGELTFEAAAAQHSTAPTAKKGGDIGAIERHGAMPEAFAAAAFTLKPGAISQPVQTAAGIHLIQPVSIVPGEKTLDDVRPELITAATKFAFNWVADAQRKTSKVQYTGATPYIQPETGEIVD